MKQNNNQPKIQKDLKEDHPVVGGKIIHTYASDLASATRESGARGGFIKQAISEARIKEKLAESQYPYSSKNILWTIGGVTLLLAGIIIIFFSFKKTPVPPPPENYRAIIETDGSSVVSVNAFDQEKILTLLKGEIEKEGVPGKIKSLFFIKDNAVLSPKDFLALIAPSAPAALSRTTSDYLFGFADNDPNKIFILLKSVTPYDFRLALGAWEEKIADDLLSFFGLTPTLPLLQLRWNDDFIVNLTARTISNESGLILGYAYLDESVVIIARDLAVFGAVNQRFFQQKLRR